MTETLSDRPTYRLPRTAYFDPAWFERELREVFGRTWNYVGHVTDLPHPGDFLAVQVGREPIIVVRQADGSLRGYLNICRHRGMVIVEGDGRSCAGSCGTSLRCPYHGWEWDLDGSLRRVPQRRTQFPDLAPEDHALLPVAVATWAGFVFVHPDPDASGGFERWLGDFPEHLPAYPWDDLVQVHRERIPVACNWKLYMENHIDWLHLWYLHDVSLGTYDHAAGWSGTVAGRHFASIEHLRAGQQRVAANGLLPIPDQPDGETATLRANSLFPNVPIVTTGTGVNTYQVIPTGPETCELDLRVFAMPGSVPTDVSLRQIRLVLHGEDGRVCEQMQEAIRSSRFAVGPLAVEHEAAIADFQAVLLDMLGESP